MSKKEKQHIQDMQRIGFAQGVMMGILWSVDELTERQKASLQEAIDGLKEIGKDDDQ